MNFFLFVYADGYLFTFYVKCYRVDNMTYTRLVPFDSTSKHHRAELISVHCTVWQMPKKSLLKAWNEYVLVFSRTGKSVRQFWSRKHHVYSATARHARAFSFNFFFPHEFITYALIRRRWRPRIGYHFEASKSKIITYECVTWKFHFWSRCDERDTNKIGRGELTQNGMEAISHPKKEESAEFILTASIAVYAFRLQ